MARATTLSPWTSKFSIFLRQFQKISNRKTTFRQSFFLKNIFISAKVDNKSKKSKIKLKINWAQKINFIANFFGKIKLNNLLSIMQTQFLLIDNFQDVLTFWKNTFRKKWQIKIILMRIKKFNKIGHISNKKFNKKEI